MRKAQNRYCGCVIPTRGAKNPVESAGKAGLLWFPISGFHARLPGSSALFASQHQIVAGTHGRALLTLRGGRERDPRKGSVTNITNE